ncbi:hypothetical protein [Saccharothrix deserti]|uniref:hypothetical protein n=1 Tax=Saccharothrix deserti TaxID=2593674 RepID=UPI00131CB50E|nr:hypothetical protein [Saccharothrix deserti]
MRNLTGRLAAVFTAAIAVAMTSGGPAGAQEDTVTIEGLVWLDRNSNGVVDAPEPGLAKARGVRVYDATTKLHIKDVGTDENGRYKAEGLPNVPLAIYSHNADVYLSTTKSTFNPVNGGGTFDFGIRGAYLPVPCWVDSDGNRSYDGEPPPPGGCPLRITGGPGVDRPVDPPNAVANITHFADVPSGEYTVTAGTLFDQGLALIEPTKQNHVDWVTYTKKITVNVGQSEPWIEAGYFAAEGDMAYTARVEPAEDGYRIGDEVDVVVPITNKGDVPERAEFVLGEPFDEQAEKLSVSDNVESDGSNLYTLKDRLLPGATAEVRFKLRIKTAFSMVNVVGTHINELPDADFGNNVVKFPVRVDDGTTTQPTTPVETTTTTTAAPTTTTTTTAPAVVQVAGGSGLASTGAVPLPLLAIGGLLVGGGALTFLAARRRRRA